MFKTLLTINKKKAQSFPSGATFIAHQRKSTVDADKRMENKKGFSQVTWQVLSFLGLTFLQLKMDMSTALSIAVDV